MHLVGTLFTRLRCKAGSAGTAFTCDRHAARPKAVLGYRPVAVLNPDQGAVFAAVGVLGIINQWMSFQVIAARKKYNVPYPRLYAEGASAEAESFNCVQRGHQNFLENLPLFLGMQLLLASIYPRTAAGLIVLWAVGRVVYFLGYAKGDPNKRLPGAVVSSLTQLGSYFAVIFLGLRAAIPG
eukprot:jgi/Botrbrau1/12055/Bobra.0295s0010.1